jgi:hypothetical protein
MMRQNLVKMVDPEEAEDAEDEEQQDGQQQNLLTSSPVRGGPEHMEMDGK